MSRASVNSASSSPQESHCMKNESESWKVESIWQYDLNQKKKWFGPLVPPVRAWHSNLILWFKKVIIKLRSTNWILWEEKYFLEVSFFAEVVLTSWTSHLSQETKTFLFLFLMTYFPLSSLIALKENDMKKFTVHFNSSQIKQISRKCDVHPWRLVKVGS